MGAKSKRGPAQPTKLKLTVNVEGFEDDCVLCCVMADRVTDVAPSGDLYLLVEVVRDLAWHVKYGTHWTVSP